MGGYSPGLWDMGRGSTNNGFRPQWVGRFANPTVYVVQTSSFNRVAREKRLAGITTRIITFYPRTVLGVMLLFAGVELATVGAKSLLSSTSLERDIMRAPPDGLSVVCRALRYCWCICNSSAQAQASAWHRDSRTIVSHPRQAPLRQVPSSLPWH